MSISLLDRNSLSRWLEERRFVIVGETGLVSFRDPVRAIPSTWEIAGSTAGLASFMLDLLNQFPTGSHIAIIQRSGEWSYPALDPDDLQESKSGAALYDWIMTKLGISPERNDAILIGVEDFCQVAWLTALLQGYMWTTKEDLTLLGESGEFIIEITHHDFISVVFSHEYESRYHDIVVKLADEYNYRKVRWTK